MSSPLLSSEDNYEIKRVLGSGSSGVVNRIITKIDDLPISKKAQQEYALKHIDLKRIRKEEREETLESAKNEYSMLKRKLDHVVPAFGSFYDQRTDFFIFSMELFPNNLKTLIEKGSGPFSFDQYLPIFQDILKG